MTDRVLPAGGVPPPDPQQLRLRRARTTARAYTGARSIGRPALSSGNVRAVGPQAPSIPRVVVPLVTDGNRMLAGIFARTAQWWEAAYGEPYREDGRFAGDGVTSCWHDCADRCWHACSEMS